MRRTGSVPNPYPGQDSSSVAVKWLSWQCRCEDLSPQVKVAHSRKKKHPWVSRRYYVTVANCLQIMCFFADPFNMCTYCSCKIYLCRKHIHAHIITFTFKHIHAHLDTSSRNIIKVWCSHFSWSTAAGIWTHLFKQCIVPCYLYLYL